ncbi:DUF2007 domain-containing protein [Anaeromassilibacillus senegalensis]|uniref:DUF2007 domain-containing protein n=1 Tax=Anaeromassilibacillus senegalensis TaxID=1673717 RepID=UPI00068189BF|nr:DUF2007 domain-containing protein [Anaeromassilibacillus senegalensis]
MFNKKWTTVYCTVDRDQLFRLQALLNTEGIEFRTAAPNQTRGVISVRTPAVQRNETGMLWELLVKEEEVEHARAIVRNL